MEEILRGLFLPHRRFILTEFTKEDLTPKPLCLCFENGCPECFPGPLVTLDQHPLYKKGEEELIAELKAGKRPEID